MSLHLSHPLVLSKILFTRSVFFCLFLFLSIHSQEKPNIVFILADDMGWHELGCYGNDFHETPHLDRLAMDGMRFTKAYAAASICAPTRAAWME